MTTMESTKTWCGAMTSQELVDAFYLEIMADGPVAYYRMNTAEKLVDSSGYGNDIDDTSGPLVEVDGINRGGVYFDQSAADAMSATHASQIDNLLYAGSGVGPFATVSALVYIESDGTNGTLICKAKHNSGGGNGNGGWWFYIDQYGHLVYKGPSAASYWTQILSKMRLVADTWYHVGIIMNNSSCEYVTMFVNGMPVATDRQSGTSGGAQWADTNNRLAIGASINTSNTYTERLRGIIDEIAVFDYALPTARLQAHAQAAGLFDYRDYTAYHAAINAASPDYWWRQRGDSGNYDDFHTLVAGEDETGLAQATTSGYILYVNAWAGGIDRMSPKFDGSSTDAILPALQSSTENMLTTGTNKFTIEVVFFCRDWTGYPGLANKGRISSGGWHVNIDAANNTIMMRMNKSGSHYTGIGPAVFDADNKYQWHHLVAWFDGNTGDMQFQLNGVLYSGSDITYSGTFGTIGSDTGYNPHWGALTNSGGSISNRFTGGIDELAIWKDWLDEADALSHWNAIDSALPSGDYVDAIMALSPVAYWPLATPWTLQQDLSGNNNHITDGTFRWGPGISGEYAYEGNDTVGNAQPEFWSTSLDNLTHSNAVLSIVATVRMDAFGWEGTGNSAMIVSKGRHTIEGWDLHIQEGNHLRFNFHKPSTRQYDTVGFSPEVGVAYHIVVCVSHDYNGSGTGVGVAYINGTQYDLSIVSAGSGSPVNDSAQRLRIAHRLGSAGSAEYRWPGVIEHLAIVTGEISSTDAADLYALSGV